MYRPVLLAATVLSLTAVPAIAEPGSEERTQTPQRATTILLSDSEGELLLEESEQMRFLSRGWITRNFRMDNKGLKFQRKLDMGDNDLILGLRAPMVRKKRVGIGIEIRF